MIVGRLSMSGQIVIRTALVLVTLICLSCLTVTTKSETVKDAVSQEFRQTPEALSEIPLQSSEIEFSELMDHNSLLLQVSRVYGSRQIWGIFNHELIMTDPDAGTIRWRKSNDVLQSTVEEIFYDENTLFISGRDYGDDLQRLTAVNREDGHILWHRRDPRFCRYFFIKGRKTIIAAGGDNSGFTIKALAADDGEERWKMERKATFALDSHPACGLIKDGEDCLIFGSFLLNISLDDGSLNWEKKINSDKSLLRDVYNCDEGILLTQKRGFTLMDRETGYKLWYDAILDAELITGSLSGDSVLGIYNNPDGLSLRSIKLGTGELNWEETLTGFPRSPITTDGNQVLVSSKTNLQCFSLFNGSLTENFDIPPFLHSDIGLADRIIRKEDRIILVRENGIVAFRKGNREALYARYVEDTEIYSYFVASQRYLLRQVARSGQGQNFDPHALSAELQNQIIRVQHGTDTAILPGSNGTASLSLTETPLICACEGCHVVAEGIAFQDEGAARNMNINRKEINAAVNCHALSLQGAYYIRPFYRDGWGLTLIRLKDGARSDLKVSPEVEPFIINSALFPLYILKDDTLIVNGFGTSRSAGNTFEKAGYGKDVYGSWPGTPTNWRLPYSSVFTFSLNNLHFNKDLESHPTEPVVQGEKEQELRKFILQRNREAVKKILDEGADLNAVDQLGWNALFYSALVDDRKIARLLVDKGADATVRDHHQFLAYHYNILTHGQSQSTNEFRAANIKQGKPKR